jgi:hypothetical protein
MPALIASGAGYTFLLSDLSGADEAGSTNNSSVESQSSNANSIGPINIRTNTSAQIRYRCGASDAGLTVYIRTVGWYDRRGRDA